MSVRIDSLFKVNIKSKVHTVSPSGVFHLLLQLAIAHAVPQRAHCVAPIARFLRLHERIMQSACQCEGGCVSMLGVEICFGPLTCVRVEQREGLATSSCSEVRLKHNLPVEMWCELVIRLSMS